MCVYFFFCLFVNFDTTFKLFLEFEMHKTLRLIMKIIITSNTGSMFDRFQSFVTLTYSGMNKLK